MTPRVTAVTLAAGGAAELFAATATPARRWFRNRGPSDATFVTGATASGAAGEISLPVGERIAAPYRTTLNVTVYSVGGTTIEGEEWA